VHCIKKAAQSDPHTAYGYELLCINAFDSISSHRNTHNKSQNYTLAVCFPLSISFEQLLLLLFESKYPLFRTFAYTTKCTT
jgi:hypothetical protein